MIKKAACTAFDKVFTIVNRYQNTDLIIHLGSREHNYAVSRSWAAVSPPNASLTTGIEVTSIFRFQMLFFVDSRDHYAPAQFLLVVEHIIHAALVVSYKLVGVNTENIHKCVIHGL